MISEQLRMLEFYERTPFTGERQKAAALRLSMQATLSTITLVVVLAKKTDIGEFKLTEINYGPKDFLGYIDKAPVFVAEGEEEGFSYVYTMSTEDVTRIFGELPPIVDTSVPSAAAVPSSEVDWAEVEEPSAPVVETSKAKTKKRKSEDNG